MSTDARASNRRRCRTRPSRSPSTRPRSPSAHSASRSSCSRSSGHWARQEDVVSGMLERYDYRLAEFAQTLSDALNQTLPARITAAISRNAIDREFDYAREPRPLERRPRPRASPASRRPPMPRSPSSARGEDPILATVGLSQAEVNQVGGLGVGDYRGARAIQVSFSRDEEIRRHPHPGRPRGAAHGLVDRSWHARRPDPHARPPVQRDRHHVSRERPHRQPTDARGHVGAQGARSRAQSAIH